jgi:hypothetical protein
MSKPLFLGVPNKKFRPGIAWFFVVLILVCTPGEDLPEVGEWFGEISFDKFIHCGIFGLLALLFMWPVAKADLPLRSKNHWCLRIALSTAVFGFITELLQLFYIPGRSFSLLDCLADIVGGFGAWLVCHLFISRRTRG